ncbi:MAG: carbohydrate-binding protein [Gammaproteobacteria bacterium]|nr:carbohydrate-binding protein [Gammaproteobacteria bacterium]
MRKRIVPIEGTPSPDEDEDWLDLGALAEVEISSEDPAYPIEAALVPGHETGWRAGKPGRQVIRLLFSPAQRVTRIRLHFEETSVARRQEYALLWSPERNQPCREIVRQQWNFSPSGATVEIEDHRVDLPTVAVLELVIDPGSEGQAVFASMESMQVA